MARAADLQSVCLHMYCKLLSTKQALRLLFSNPMQNPARNLDGALLGVAALLFATGVALVHASPNHLPLVLRWTGILLLAVWAVRRRSLTPWIFVAMVAGAEFGYDAPTQAVN